MSSKMLVFQPRRADLTHEQFSDHWRTVHADHARRITALQKYVQSHRAAEIDALLSTTVIEPAVYDGVSEAWFNDTRALAGMTASAEYREGALLDEPNFLDIPRKVRLLTSERIVRCESGCEDAELTKLVVAVSGNTKEAVDTLGLDDRGSLADLISALPGVVRYVVCDVVTMVAELEHDQIHAVLELGWREPGALREALRAPEATSLFKTVAQAAPTSTAMAVHELRLI